MTIGIGFVYGNHAYVAADKRTTQLNSDGSNRSYTDGSSKIFMLSPSVYAFCGGVVQATQPLMAKITQQFSGKDLNENDLSRISQLCKEQYSTFMASIDESLTSSSWIKDFVLSVIIAQNSNGNSRLIRFDIEDNFEPVIQSNHGALCVKSAIEPETLWPEIQKISEAENRRGFNPEKFINGIIKKASDMDSAISPVYDVVMVGPQNNKVLAFQKLTAGKITATIEIVSPLINGGMINGVTITGGIFRTEESGSRLEMTETGLTCYATGMVKSGICIANHPDIGWGDLQYYYNDVLEGGLQYNTSDAMSLYSRNGKSISIDSDGDIALNAAGRVIGIRADKHVQGPHNHGIGKVHLATVDPETGDVNGMVEWLPSGGFELSHNIY